MKKLILEMPEVSSCSVTNCAYNTKGACHAKAITVGDAINPDCDTYFVANAHARNTRVIAGVGACKASNCRFNKDFECTANNINIGFLSDEVRCLTFQPR